MRLNLRCLFIILLIIILHKPLYSQDRQQLFDAFIETLEQGINDEEKSEEMINYYINIYNSPFDVNTCSGDDLVSLNILSNKEIKVIVQYRTKSPFLSVYELNSIIDIDQERFSNLFPFIKTGDEKVKVKKDIIEMLGGFSTVFNSNKNQNILGDLYSFRYKLKADFGKINGGLALKKEIGEPFKWSIKDQWYYFEHISGFLQVEHLGIIKSITLGNYRIGNGSGLILSNGSFNSKTVNPILFSQQPNIGSKPFSSFLENSAFKGITSTIQLRNITFIPFFSIRSLNGKANNNATSISESSNANTFNLTKQRKELQLIETGISMNSSLKSLPLNLGFNFISSSFRKPVSFTKNYYSKRVPEKNNLSGSFFLTSRFKGIYIWSEWALNSKFSLNTVTGVSFSLGHQSDLTLSYRNFSTDFYSFHSNPGSHYGNHTDEEGFYAALSIEPLKDTQIKAYTDLVRSRYLRYQLKIPSHLFDSRISLEHKFNREHRITLWLRMRTTLSANKNAIPINRYSNLDQNEYSIQFSAGDILVSKTRIGVKTSRFEAKKTLGSFIYQQLSIKVSRVNAICRLSLFEVDDFENRFYVYENDLSNNFKTHLINNTGYKLFLMSKIQVNPFLKMEVKWSYSQYFDDKPISSPVFTVNGLGRHDIAFQAIIKL